MLFDNNTQLIYRFTAINDYFVHGNIIKHYSAVIEYIQNWNKIKKR